MTEKNNRSFPENRSLYGPAVCLAAVLSALTFLNACAAPAVTAASSGAAVEQIAKTDPAEADSAASSAAEEAAETVSSGSSSPLQETADGSSPAEAPAAPEPAGSSASSSAQEAAAQQTSPAPAQGNLSASTPGRRIYSSYVEDASAASSVAVHNDPGLLPSTGGSDNTWIAFKPDQDLLSPPAAWQSGYPRTEKAIENQLAELASYWEAGRMDSVDYLIRLPRFEYVSGMLSGTNDYYYQGGELKDGTPDGKGIAVYAENSYYYGEFKNGLREGEGVWIRVYPRDGIYAQSNNGIYYHSYTGSWKNNLPDGEGHEHISHDRKYQKRRLTTNVIGTFKEGLYDGEEYLLTVSPDGEQQNWTGIAVKGTFLPAASNYPKRVDGEQPVARNMDLAGDYIWMTQKNNRKQGVTGIVDAPG